jgi:hypothetical protein
MNRLLKAAAVLLCAVAVPALAQGYRYDNRVVTVATNVPRGASGSIYAVPYAQVTICPTSACSSASSIFADQALSVPVANPITTDTTGSFGFWAAAGTYYYQVQTSRGIVGTYPFTLGGSGGGGGSGTVTSVAGGSPLYSISNPTTNATLVLQNAAGHTVFGNNTGSTLAPFFFSLTYGDIAGTPPLFGSSTVGAVPASGGGASNFLRADGTWAVPATSGGASFSGSAGIVYNTSTTASRNALAADIAALWAGGACFGLMKGDGTCAAAPAGTIVGTTDTQVLTNKTITSPTMTGTVTLSVTGSTQCLQVNSSGILSGTGSACGAGGGSGTVSGQTSGVLPLATGATSLTAPSHFTDNGTTTGTTLPFAVSAAGSTSIATSTASNTDLAGQITLSSGSGSYTFTGTYTSAPICVVSDTSGLNAARPTITTTTLTINGTGSDVVNYICIARN